MFRGELNVWKYSSNCSGKYPYVGNTNDFRATFEWRKIFLHVVIVFVTNEEETKVKFNALVLEFFVKILQSSFYSVNFWLKKAMWTNKPTNSYFHDKIRCNSDVIHNYVPGY